MHHPIESPLFTYLLVFVLIDVLYLIHLNDLFWINLRNFLLSLLFTVNWTYLFSRVKNSLWFHCFSVWSVKTFSPLICNINLFCVFHSLILIFLMYIIINYWLQFIIILNILRVNWNNCRYISHWWSLIWLNHEEFQILRTWLVWVIFSMWNCYQWCVALLGLFIGLELMYVKH